MSDNYIKQPIESAPSTEVKNIIDSILNLCKSGEDDVCKDNVYVVKKKLEELKELSIKDYNEFCTNYRFNNKPFNCEQKIKEGDEYLEKKKKEEELLKTQKKKYYNNKDMQNQININNLAKEMVDLESDKGGKKAKRTTKKRGGNDWTRLVTKTFKDNKKKNKSYTFKQAILDAKKVYKKKGGESDNNQNNNNQNNNNGNNTEFNENNENNNNFQEGGKKSRKNRKNKTKKGGQENNQNQSE